ncbi:MAG TPA: hypothetical protein VK501_02165 [Baekduia sp.]|nr:hypothetical protein [Baekduia sp.]HMJ32694.1 hypothetical protein [Baekduia sp.]
MTRAGVEQPAAERVPGPPPPVLSAATPWWRRSAEHRPAASHPA